MELIENHADCEFIGAAQRAFVQSVQAAMDAYKAGEIQVETRALPDVMYDFVLNDMPDLCAADRDTLILILKKLRLFLNTMDLLVCPTEITPQNPVNLSHTGAKGDS